MSTNKIQLKDVADPLSLRDTLNDVLDKTAICVRTKGCTTETPVQEMTSFLKGEELVFSLISLENLGEYIYRPGKEGTHTYFYFYLIDNTTKEGFRCDCNLKRKNNKDLTIGRNPYVINFQVHAIKNKEIEYTILEKSISADLIIALRPSLDLEEGAETSYSFINTFKNLTNIVYFYEDRDAEEHYQDEATSGTSIYNGVAIYKRNTVSDGLNDAEGTKLTPIDHYVKFDPELNDLVEITENTKVPLNAHDKIREAIAGLEDNIKDSRVVNITEFKLASANTWPTESQIAATSALDGDQYIVNTADGLHYYKYKDYIEDVELLNYNSAFYKTLFNSYVEVYTSDAYNTVREGNPARVNRSVKNLSEIRFDVYMSPRSINYYPEIALVAHEGFRRVIELQLVHYNGKYELKLIGFGRDAISIAQNLPYNENTKTFHANFKITIQNAIITIRATYYKTVGNTQDTYIIDLKNHRNYKNEYTTNGKFSLKINSFADLENVYFGLRYDGSTPPNRWGGFSNIQFRKSYWEKQYPIQPSTLYIDASDNSLYRYTDVNSTRPYPNFVRVTASATGATGTVDVPGAPVYVTDSTEKALTNNTQLHKGDTLIFKWTGDAPTMGTAAGSNGEYFYFGWITNGVHAGWNMNGMPFATTHGQHTTYDYTKYNNTITYVYTGPDCTLTNVYIPSTDTQIMIQESKKAVYNHEGTQTPLDINMLSGNLAAEKIINISSYISQGALINFSMQGYTHFQILSGTGPVSFSDPRRFSQIMGMVATKTDSVCYGIGHTNTAPDESNFWSEHIRLSMRYDAETDTVSLDPTGSPLMLEGTPDYISNQVFLYIRLFNVEGASL